MFAAGMNFALWYRGLFRTPRWFLRDEEFRLYVACIVGRHRVLAWMLYGDQFHDLEGSIRHATFQVVTTMTTTGYASTDFALWPGARHVRAGDADVHRRLRGVDRRRDQGRCASSSWGGRCGARCETAAHPQHVKPIRITGRTVEEDVVRAALAFILLYVLIFALGVVILLIEGDARGLDLGAIDAIAASATTIGNVGPGFGFAGPFGSFAPFGDGSTLTMIVLMWIGRLELIPVLVLATRAYWRR